MQKAVSVYLQPAWNDVRQRRMLIKNTVGKFRRKKEKKKLKQQNTELIDWSSSRSHAVFTIYFAAAQIDGNLPREISAKVHLVDLAGR